MRVDIIVPRFDNSSDDVTLSSWYKRVGDKISKNEIIADAETTTVACGITSSYDCILAQICVKEGEEITQGTKIAVIETDVHANTDDIKKANEAETAVEELKEIESEIDADVKQKRAEEAKEASERAAAEAERKAAEKNEKGKHKDVLATEKKGTGRTVGRSGKDQESNHGNEKFTTEGSRSNDRGFAEPVTTDINDRVSDFSENESYYGVHEENRSDSSSAEGNRGYSLSVSPRYERDEERLLNIVEAERVEEEVELATEAEAAAIGEEIVDNLYERSEKKVSGIMKEAEIKAREEARALREQIIEEAKKQAVLQAEEIKKKILMEYEEKASKESSEMYQKIVQGSIAEAENTRTKLVNEAQEKAKNEAKEIHENILKAAEKKARKAASEITEKIKQKAKNEENVIVGHAKNEAEKRGKEIIQSALEEASAEAKAIKKDIIHSAYKHARRRSEVIVAEALRDARHTAREEASSIFQSTMANAENEARELKDEIFHKASKDIRDTTDGTLAELIKLINGEMSCFKDNLMKSVTDSAELEIREKSRVLLAQLSKDTEGRIRDSMQMLSNSILAEAHQNVEKEITNLIDALKNASKVEIVKTMNEARTELIKLLNESRANITRLLNESKVELEKSLNCAQISLKDHLSESKIILKDATREAKEDIVGSLAKTDEFMNESLERVQVQLSEKLKQSNGDMQFSIEKAREELSESMKLVNEEMHFALENAKEEVRGNAELASEDMKFSAEKIKTEMNDKLKESKSDLEKAVFEARELVKEDLRLTKEEMDEVVIGTKEMLHEALQKTLETSQLDMLEAIKQARGAIAYKLNHVHKELNEALHTTKESVANYLEAEKNNLKLSSEKAQKALKEAEAEIYAAERLAKNNIEEKELSVEKELETELKTEYRREKREIDSHKRKLEEQITADEQKIREEECRIAEEDLEIIKNELEIAKNHREVDAKKPEVAVENQGILREEHETAENQQKAEKDAVERAEKRVALEGVTAAEECIAEERLAKKIVDREVKAVEEELGSIDQRKIIRSLLDADRPDNTADMYAESWNKPTFFDSPEDERTKIDELKQRLSERRKESMGSSVISTVSNEVDMSSVLTLEKAFGEAFVRKYNIRLGFTPFFILGGIEALKQYRVFNAHIHGDEIIYKNTYDIAIITCGNDGVIAPVIRHADVMTVDEIERSMINLSRRAIEGTLSVEEVSGGTFTVVNAGVYGSLIGTDLLTPPQVATLSVHRMHERPIATDKGVEVRPMLYISLSYDHRVADTKVASNFLEIVKKYVENPGCTLLGL